MDIDSSIADRAVYGAMRILGHPDASPQDWDDMRQEVELAVWRTYERGKGYAYRSGVNAGIAWWREYVLDWKRHDAGPEPTPQSATCEFDDEWVQPEKCNVQPVNDWLDTTELQRLVESKRKIGGDRGTRANERDVTILLLICQGNTTQGIAKEMGISPETIKRYRSELRNWLGQVTQ